MVVMRVPDQHRVHVGHRPVEFLDPILLRIHPALELLLAWVRIERCGKHDVVCAPNQESSYPEEPHSDRSIVRKDGSVRNPVMDRKTTGWCRKECRRQKDRSTSFHIHLDERKVGIARGGLPHPIRRPQRRRPRTSFRVEAVRYPEGVARRDYLVLVDSDVDE
jgi:hypothetical protein